MADQVAETGNKTRLDWMRLLYQLAHSDIRWAKEQGWRVVNWALLLFAASLGLYKFLHDVSLWVFALLDAAIGVIAILYLTDLHHFAAVSRDTGSRIQTQMPKIDDILTHRAWDRNHVAYFVVKVTVVVVALVLTVLALRYARS